MVVAVACRLLDSAAEREAVRAVVQEVARTVNFRSRTLDDEAE
jgi:hypothetical protein